MDFVILRLPLLSLIPMECTLNPRLKFHGQYKVTEKSMEFKSLENYCVAVQ